jgi:hypothetical protein
MVRPPAPAHEAADIMSSTVRKEVAYIHQDLGQFVTAIGGHYVLVKEVRLPYHGRELLYLVGHAAFDTSCCGPGGCAYALVPGFVTNWRNSRTEEGLAVSQVEPVREPDVQSDIRGLIERVETIQQVVFQ